VVIPLLYFTAYRERGQRVAALIPQPAQGD